MREGRGEHLEGWLLGHVNGLLPTPTQVSLSASPLQYITKFTPSGSRDRPAEGRGEEEKALEGARRAVWERALTVLPSPPTA